MVGWCYNGRTYESLLGCFTLNAFLLVITVLSFFNGKKRKRKAGFYYLELSSFSSYFWPQNDENVEKSYKRNYSIYENSKSTSQIKSYILLLLCFNI